MFDQGFEINGLPENRTETRSVGKISEFTSREVKVRTSHRSRKPIACQSQKLSRNWSILTVKVKKRVEPFGTALILLHILRTSNENVVEYGYRVRTTNIQGTRRFDSEQSTQSHARNRERMHGEERDFFVCLF